MLTKIGLFAVSLSVLAGGGFAQSTWYVDASASPPGSGTPFAPFTNLQFAIEQPTTLPGDTLVVMPGTYYGNVDYLGKGLTVESSEGAGSTVLDARGSGSVVTLLSGDGLGMTLRGFTLRGGTGTRTATGIRGGGVWARGARARIEDCRVVDCLADYGGGVAATNSSLELVNSRIEDIECGGGIYVEGLTDLQLSGCTLQRIEPTDCNDFNVENIGALWAANSTLTAVDCIFADNAAFDADVQSRSASGALLIDCTSKWTECTFTGHGIGSPFSIDVMGAMSVLGGEAWLENCAFTDNRNEYRGGALSVHGATLTIRDSSFTGNDSYDNYYGGALYASDIAASTVIVSGTRFEDNEGADGGAAYIGSGIAFFEGCSFENNESIAFYFEDGSGGAVFGTPSANVVLDRCTLTGNVSWGNPSVLAGRGGAAAGATLVNCTLVGNEVLGTVAPPEGGAVYDCSLTNSICWDNVPDQVGGVSSVEGSNIRGGYPGTGNIDEGPLFWDEEGGDLHLLEGSPCIDAGNPGLPPDPDGSLPDMGAFPFEVDYCGTPRTYCEALVNSQGCTPSIGWTGLPTVSGPDDFHITATDVLNAEMGILVWGNESANSAFAGGTMCVALPFVRTPVLSTGGSSSGVDCTGEFDFFFSQEYMAAQGVVPYSTVYAQFWYRDPLTVLGVGLTDGIRFVVCAGLQAAG